MKRSIFVVPGVALAVLICGLAVVMAEPRSWGFAAENSDLVQAFLQVQDLFEGRLPSWDLPPALFAFPDWIIAGLTLLVPVPAGWRMGLFAALMLALQVAGAACLFWCIEPRKALGRTVLFATITMCGYYLAHLTIGRLVWMLANLATPSIHAGTAVVSMACIGLFMAVEDGGRRGLTALLALFCLLSVVSDAMFIAWFVAPIALYTWAKDPSPDLRRHWKRLAPILVPSALGVVALLLSNAGEALSIKVSPIEAFWIFADDVVANIGDPPSAVYFAGAVALLLRAGWLARRLRSLTMVERAEFILGITLACVIAAPIVTGAFYNLALWRYMLYAPLLVAAWASLTLGRLAMPWVYGLVGAGAMVFCLSAAAISAPAALARIGEDDLVACLAEHGLRDGYGDYWTAKRVIFLSGRQQHVAQLTGVQPHHWIFNRQWYQTRADGTPFRPRFIVTTGLPEDQLREYFGAPDAVLPCGDQTIWSYDRDLPLVPG